MFENKKKTDDGIWEVEPKDLCDNLLAVTVIDVRRADEFKGELGHIDGALLVTLETDLLKTMEAWDKSDDLVFVCRSGGRSAKAAILAQGRGFKNVFNLRGGMLQWNEEKLPLAVDD